MEVADCGETDPCTTAMPSPAMAQYKMQTIENIFLEDIKILKGNIKVYK